MGKPDTSNMDDGDWFFIYFVIDLAVLALSIPLAIAMVCIEIGCWILAGGYEDD